MNKSVEITPYNVRLLFGTESVPARTCIIIKRSNDGIIAGKVFESRVYSKDHGMIIKLDRSDKIFSYPTDRFFLPYITASRRVCSERLAIRVAPPSVVCQG